MKKDNIDNEIFTPEIIVKEMVDTLPEELWQERKTFIDPACGNGNLLIEVFLCKTKKGHNPLEALKTLYGCDIVAKNIKECRLRLLKEINNITLDDVKTVMKNIVWLDPKSFPNGSLDYDFSFHNEIKNEEAQKWFDYFCDKIKEEPEIRSEINEGNISNLFFAQKK